MSHNVEAAIFYNARPNLPHLADASSSSTGCLVKFFFDNLYLIVIALASGGMLLWPLLKRGSGSASVSPLQATQLINHRNAIVIDVRDEAAFAAGSVTGARNIPFAKLAERTSEYARFKARPAIVVCESGQQSARALATLKAQGFEETHALAGGLSAWKQAGLPLVHASRDTARIAPKENAKIRSRAEARAYDKARADAKAARRGAAATDAAGLNGRAVLAEARADAVVDPTSPTSANDASGSERVKEVS